VNWIKLDMDGVRRRYPVVTGINHRISKEGIILLAAVTVVRVQIYHSWVLVYTLYSQRRELQVAFVTASPTSNSKYNLADGPISANVVLMTKS
jgi:hypothetical protein